MPQVYDARILNGTLQEVVQKHNRLVDLLGKDLSGVVIGGGVGDVKSPVTPGSTDGFVPLWDGTTGKRLKDSSINGAWFNQDVSSTASVEFYSVDARQSFLWSPTDDDCALSLMSPTRNAGVWYEVSDAETSLEMWAHSGGEPGVTIEAMSVDLVTGKTTLDSLEVTNTITIGGAPVVASAVLENLAIVYAVALG